MSGKRKHGRTSKRKGRKMGIGMIITGFLVVLIAVAVINITNLEIKKARLIAENQQLAQQIEEKQEELSHVDDDDYVESQARQKLNMVYKGEKIYLMPDEEEY